MGPGFTQEGIDFPDVDFRVKLNMRSCGVALVAVHSKDLIEWRASGRTDSHSESGILREWRVTWIAFHNVPFNFSTWPLHFGLYRLVFDVDIDLLRRYSCVSPDRKSVALSLWTMSGIPKIEKRWLKQWVCVACHISTRIAKREVRVLNYYSKWILVTNLGLR